jgi:H+/Cl- antiporter ClcA
MIRIIRLLHSGRNGQHLHPLVTTLPREVPSPDDKPVYPRRRYGLGCGIFAGIKTSTFGSTLSRHFNNFLPPHQRYFNNYINRRTLLIMIGITFASVLALIIGLAAGLSIGSKYVVDALPIFYSLH